MPTNPLQDFYYNPMDMFSSMPQFNGMMPGGNFNPLSGIGSMGGGMPDFSSMFSNMGFGSMPMGGSGGMPDFNSLFSGMSGGMGGMPDFGMNGIPAGLPFMGAGGTGGGGGFSSLPGFGGDPISAMLFGGGGGDGFKSYVDENGNFVWRSPKKINPTPLATVPGATLRPSKEYRDTANQIQALKDLFPTLSKILAGQIIPQEQAKLAASQAVSDPYAKLMSDLYAKYGPILNQTGNEINRQNALYQAGTDNQVLTGPGSELIRNAHRLAMENDPEFYNTRALTADKIAQLMGSIDLTGGLSDTERREIGQGLTREGIQRGTSNAPSSTETVSNAMRYGEAGNQRKLQQQNSLSQAIAAANQFIPASRSGVDVFQVATGRSSSPNPGAGLFPGVNNEGGNTLNTLAGLGSNFQNNTNALQLNNDTIASQKKDWLDKFVQFTQGISNIASSAGSIAGIACWIAREVYGASNPKWTLFRQWLTTKSPLWFQKLYIDYGSIFAMYIKNKPELKLEIQQWMDERIA